MVTPNGSIGRPVYGTITGLASASFRGLTVEEFADAGKLYGLWQYLITACDWIDRYCGRSFAGRYYEAPMEGGGGLAPDILVLPDEMVAPLALVISDVDYGVVADASLRKIVPAEGSARAKNFLDQFLELPVRSYVSDGANGTPFVAAHFQSPTFNRLRITPAGEAVTMLQLRENAADRDLLLKAIAGRYRTMVIGEFGSALGGLTYVGQLGLPSAYNTGAQPTSHFREMDIGQTVRLSDVQRDSNLPDTVVTVTQFNGSDTWYLLGLNGYLTPAYAAGIQYFKQFAPAGVEGAALITASRLIRRAPEFEPFYVDVDLDTDVRLLLEPYRRLVV